MGGASDTCSHAVCLDVHAWKTWFLYVASTACADIVAQDVDKCNVSVSRIYSYFMLQQLR